ncbi:MAG TPA: efflux RND transporter periplasmic adaptor subunit [Terriglobales bacterium]|nr:efflux RND transporter periplasmic adaptor subunit [Terriglobales bacterium]
MTLQRSHIVIGVVVLAAIIAITLLMHSLGDAKAKKADEPPRRLAPVVFATRSPLENAITLTGEFRPFQQVDVHAKVSGYIRHIFVDVGDKVSTGQELAVLEVPELNAQVMGAEADIRRSQDAIRRAQSEIERAESTHRAYHAAYTRLKQASEERPGLVAEQELDDAMAKDKETEAQIDSTRAALAESQGQLGMAQAALARLSALQAYSHITAPFAGVVTKRYVDTGALISAGTASETQSQPVVQLAEWSLLRLVIPVPASSVPLLHLGSVVQVHVLDLNRDFQGRVARFADALNDETRTMHTEIDVENPQNTLTDGMYAEVKLVLHGKEDALTVPVQAVIQEGNNHYVLALDDRNRVQKRNVELGEQTSTTVEIVHGLAEKERVISAGQSDYAIGEVVTPKLEQKLEPGSPGASDGHTGERK